MFIFARSGVVEYCASQNATPATSEKAHQINKDVYSTSKLRECKAITTCMLNYSFPASTYITNMGSSDKKVKKKMKVSDWMFLLVSAYYTFSTISAEWHKAGFPKAVYNKVLSRFKWVEYVSQNQVKD